MSISTHDIENYLRNIKSLFYNKFGVIRIGLFGSFVLGQQTTSSDIDIIVEFEKNERTYTTFSASNGCWSKSWEEKWILALWVL